MKRAIEVDDDDDGLFDQRDERPLSRSRRGLPWLRMTLFSALCIAALAFLAQHEVTVRPPGGAKPVPATVLIAPPPTWTPMVPASTAYSLDKTWTPSLAVARQHSGGGREDTLVVGVLGEPRYARVTLTHSVPATPRSFYVDIVRGAAEAGLSVERSAQTTSIPTKFGAVESALVTLAGTAEQTCQAFRFRDEEAAFAFQGWLCGSEAQTLERREVACFVDSLALSGAADGTLKAIFVRSEKNRKKLPTACPDRVRWGQAGDPTLTAT